MWLGVIYYGAVGSVSYLIIGQLLGRVIGVPNRLFVAVAALLFWQTMGGFVSLRPWGYLAVVGAIAIVRQGPALGLRRTKLVSRRRVGNQEEPAVDI